MSYPALVLVCALVVLLALAWTLWRRFVYWFRRWHHGLHFRSLTEVAWARWFEHQRIEYRYECRSIRFWHEGRIRGYLPDFYLVSDGIVRPWGPWVEIKGVPPTPYERVKAQALADQTGDRVTILSGWPGRHTVYQVYPRRADVGELVGQRHPYRPLRLRHR